jgi:hypothetical protein
LRGTPIDRRYAPSTADNDVGVHGTSHHSSYSRGWAPTQLALASRRAGANVGAHPTREPGSPYDYQFSQTSDTRVHQLVETGSALPVAGLGSLGSSGRSLSVQNGSWTDGSWTEQSSHRQTMDGNPFGTGTYSPLNDWQSESLPASPWNNVGYVAVPAVHGTGSRRMVPVPRLPSFWKPQQNTTNLSEGHRSHF